MKTLDRLRSALESVGASLDWSAGLHAAYCDAPSGYVWVGTGTRSLTIVFDNGRQTWLKQAVRQALENLREGLEKVTDEAEIVRHRWDTGEDDWGAPPAAPDFIAWPKGVKL